MNRAAFLVKLHRYIRDAGSQKAAAIQLGISDAYLCDVKKGRRGPGVKILTALGLARVEQYTELPTQPTDQPSNN